MYKNILIPLDGSELAELASDHARGLVSLCGSQLAFVRVAEEDEVHEAARYLQRVTEDTGARGMVKFGDPAEQIVAAAHEVNADLIVLSSHGRTGLVRSLFGSVAEAVVRKATCPVLVVKALPPE